MAGSSLLTALKYYPAWYGPVTTSQITSFIVWYMWAWSVGLLSVVIASVGQLHLSSSLPVLAWLCVCVSLLTTGSSKNQLFRIPSGCSLVFCAMQLRTSALVRGVPSPTGKKPYSRIDMAKNKYGGGRREDCA